MNATESRLMFEMEDARSTIEWLEKEQTRCEQLAEKYANQGRTLLQSYFWKQAATWKQYKQEAHEWYYRAKHELKTLKAQTHAA